MPNKRVSGFARTLPAAATVLTLTLTLVARVKVESSCSAQPPTPTPSVLYNYPEMLARRDGLHEVRLRQPRWMHFVAHSEKPAEAHDERSPLHWIDVRPR